MTKDRFPLTRQGVRNLDVMPARNVAQAMERVRPLPEDVAATSPAFTSHDVVVALHDVLYDDTDELRQEVLSIWPDARFSAEHDHDGIRGDRLGVDIPMTSMRRWYRFLIRARYTHISFRFQLSMALGGTHLADGRSEVALIMSLMDSEHPGWRQKRKGA